MNINEYMKRIENEASSNGVTFKETVKNDTTNDAILDESSYVQNLHNSGMMSDTLFKQFEKKYDMDWGHVREVIKRSEQLEHKRRQESLQNKNVNKNQDQENMNLMVMQEMIKTLNKMQNKLDDLEKRIR